MMHVKPTIVSLLSNAPAQLCVKDLLGPARRLVFSHVNQALCRIYQETDPSLGKLIRNLKLAVKTFCQKLFDGESVAEAIYPVRRTIYKAGDPTWLAYSIYAHPNARIK